MSKWLTSAMILCLLATGCGNVARNETSPSPNTDSRVKAQQSAPPVKPISNPKEVSAHLEKLAMQVPGVNGAHCVVFKNTAIVGIDVDGNLDRSRIGTIKYAVAEAFHKDPYGINAIVTADMDLSHRLRDIQAEMKRGRPFAGIAEELADIVGRIVPQLPRDVHSPSVEPGKQEQPKINKSL